MMRPIGYRMETILSRLERGAATTVRLVKESETGSTTVYDALGRLRDLGLVQSTRKRRGKRWRGPGTGSGRTMNRLSDSELRRRRKLRPHLKRTPRVTL